MITNWSQNNHDWKSLCQGCSTGRPFRRSREAQILRRSQICDIPQQRETSHECHHGRNIAEAKIFTNTERVCFAQLAVVPTYFIIYYSEHRFSYAYLLVHKSMFSWSYFAHKVSFRLSWHPGGHFACYLRYFCAWGPLSRALLIPTYIGKGPIFCN